MIPTTCADCGGALEAGLVVDRFEASMVQKPYWVQGDPEMAKVFGLPLGMLKTSGRSRFEVISLRCTECGLLRSYAPADRPKTGLL